MIKTNSKYYLKNDNSIQWYYNNTALSMYEHFCLKLLNTVDVL